MNKKSREWSAEWPKKTGFYWMKTIYKNEIHTTIVEIIKMPGLSGFYMKMLGVELPIALSIHKKYGIEH